MTLIWNLQLRSYMHFFFYLLNNLQKHLVHYVSGEHIKLKGGKSLHIQPDHIYTYIQIIDIRVRISFQIFPSFYCLHIGQFQYGHNVWFHSAQVRPKVRDCNFLFANNKKKKKCFPSKTMRLSSISVFAQQIHKKTYRFTWLLCRWQKKVFFLHAPPPPIYVCVAG